MITTMAQYRCAILDDYQNVALKMADWAKLAGKVDLTVFNEHLGSADNVVRALQEFHIIAAMRERTPFPRAVIEALPNLRLLITTGAANRSFDVTTAQARNVVVCGTPSIGNPTAGITFGLIIELTRGIGYEHSRLKAGATWQTVLGTDLEGLTLGVIGLGRLGARVAEIAKAFRMKVVAWSQNLTAEKCREHGVDHVSKEELFRQSDIATIHLQLSERTRGLITAQELGLMKPSAYLINTSRGPIIEEASLIAALRNKTIAGAGLDVFDIEPLPVDHALRKLDNVVLTPHLGYVSAQNYRAYYAGIVEDILAFLDGKPVRVIS
jgi:D-3-phosphoglycerate dehydrogenase